MRGAPGDRNASGAASIVNANMVNAIGRVSVAGEAIAHEHPMRGSDLAPGPKRGAVEWLGQPGKTREGVAGIVDA